MKNIGIFIDGENVSPKKVLLIYDRLKLFGNIIIKKIYDDFIMNDSSSMKKWNEMIKTHDFEPVHSQSLASKNSCDIKMTVEVMEYLFKYSHLDIFILISSDSDFSSLIKKLREYNKFVICVGESFTASIIKENCNKFINLNETIKLAQIKTFITNCRQLNNHNLSNLKDQLKLFDPDFDEKEFGYYRFSKFIQENFSEIIKIHMDEDGGHKVIKFL